MSAWELPVCVNVGGQSFAIRSDFRAVLDALAALNDPDMSAAEQRMSFLMILFPGWENLPDAKEALTAAFEFVNGGKDIEPENKPRHALIDWKLDASLIAPAIDKVLGYSCRRCEYLHWWEFLGAFQCIGDGTFAQVIAIRSKRAHGKKLEKYEQEFARENAGLINPRPKLSTEEKEEKERLLAMLAK